MLWVLLALAKSKVERSTTSLKLVFDLPSVPLPKNAPLFGVRNTDVDFQCCYGSSKYHPIPPKPLNKYSWSMALQQRTSTGSYGGGNNEGWAWRAACLYGSSITPSIPCSGSSCASCSVTPMATLSSSCKSSRTASSGSLGRLWSRIYGGYRPGVHSARTDASDGRVMAARGLKSY